MELQRFFEQAVANSKLLSSKPDNETLLKLYSLYKQATDGDVSADNEPSNPFDFVAKAKFNAWNELKGKTKEDAMQGYVDLVNQLRG
ncbi:MAG TPA: acyl-CoA-binding protein [Panacibacter sp.]|nr:acyl-CoA-binding protein [Panacibacter sp.]HNP45138.1 acyl-CoA-binding protein [Panacibacter sp.]